MFLDGIIRGLRKIHTLLDLMVRIQIPPVAGCELFCHRQYDRSTSNVNREVDNAGPNQGTGGGIYDATVYASGGR